MSGDWRAVRDAKNASWNERVSRLGPREAFRIADELRRQAMFQHPGWPDAAERHQDLAAHIRVTTLLRRASSARRA